MKKLKAMKKMIDKALRRYLKPEKGLPSLIYRAMIYSVFAGGKRLRPILMLLSAKSCGLRESEAMPVACGIEMIHTYSLIHDDLPSMDNDDYRRGRLTSHKKFGEAEAVLAGDALLTLAFETIAGSAKGRIRSPRVIKVIREIASASGAAGMVGGQVLDIRNERRKIGHVALSRMHSLKTGALIAASVAAGPLLAGSKKNVIEAYRNFGIKTGLAFQIADDILDATSTTKKLGKTAGKDAKAGKATYVRLLGLKKAREKALNLVLEAKRKLGKIGNNTKDMENLADYFISRAY